MELYPAQKEGAEILSKQRTHILGDGIASGKTRTVLAAWRYLLEVSDLLLIVGPASVVYLSWPNEIKRVMPNTDVTLFRMTRAGRMAAYDEISRSSKPQILLMSYEIMVKDIEILRVLLRVKRGVIAADEAHAFKNYRSKRSKAWRSLIPVSVAAWTITGTLGEQPEHIYGADQALGLNSFGSRKDFLNRYCVCNRIDVVTPTKKFTLQVPIGFKATAADIIKKWMGKNVLRRPPDRTKLPILLPPQKRIIELSEAKRKEYKKLKENPDGDSFIQNFFNLRKLIAESKLDDLVENLLPQLLEDRTTLIFTPFLTQAELIRNRIVRELGIECATFTGNTSHADRKSFLEGLGSRYKVMVMTEAGKEGVDGFQRASALVFYDYPWSASDKEQIIGRIHRIGQDDENVLVIFLHAEKSVDDKLEKLLEDKAFNLDLLRGMAEEQWRKLYREI